MCRQLPAWLRGAAGALQVLIAETAAAFARCVLWLLQPVLVLALRSAVRSRAFWERGLGSAWCALLSSPLKPALCFKGRPIHTGSLPACFPIQASTLHPDTERSLAPQHARCMTRERAGCRFQKTGVTASILDAYRLPQLVQGWEWGLLRFLRARVTSEPRTCTAVMLAVTWLSCLTKLGMCCRQHGSNLQHHCGMCTQQ